MLIHMIIVADVARSYNIVITDDSNIIIYVIAIMILVGTYSNNIKMIVRI